MKELLRFERVHYRYGESQMALREISVTLREGERVAILGNNGAGKSTFFLCCNGVLHPQGGRIFLRGSEIAGKKDVLALRQAIGLVFQEPDSQIIAPTVESEVSFGPMNLRLEQGEVIARVEDSLAKMNLTGYESRAPQYLSGGEKKRVSIADILAMRPSMILLDEPTASLDPQNTMLLEQTLNDLSRAGITLAVSTHDVDFAYCFAERAIVFNHGDIIADGSVDEVFGSDDILLRAGLKKPLLYAAAEALEKRFPGAIQGKMPRTVKELQSYLERLKL